MRQTLLSPIQWLISEQTADLGRARRPRQGSVVTRVPLRTASNVKNAIEETKRLFVFS